MSARPACDKHKNLQMIDCWIETPTGIVSGYKCAVPACLRQHDGNDYISRKYQSREDSDAYKNRLQTAREAIVKAIGHY